MVPRTQRVVSEAKPRKYRESKEREIVLSVDLGKMQDFTAFTISEILPERRDNKQGRRITVKTANVRDIQRVPLGTSYHDIADMLFEVYYDDRLMLIDPETKNPIRPTMLVDSSGVGEGVADDLTKRLGLAFVRYRLVRGTAETRKAPRNYTVPRTRMFEQLYAAFTDDRIRINPKLKLAQALLEELRNLRPEANEETGYVKVVHREGEHDDMAICLASTNWWCNRPRGQPLRLVQAEGDVIRKLMAQRRPDHLR
jgi:hypothetical protein